MRRRGRLAWLTGTVMTVLIAGAALPARAAEGDPQPVVSATASEITQYYTIETIQTPEGLSAETGGIDFTPSGKLVACFHRGEVYVYDPASDAWRLFAHGLHDPLGLAALSEREVVVVQRAELTRLRDTDGDGAADAYLTLCDAFGVTGNYHEFPFGPAVDAAGNFFLALGLASNGEGPAVQHEVRGRRSPHALSTRAKYALVPWRGWVVKVSPAGELTPVASGFREPNGIGFDAEGNLWVADNQGDWVGTSKLFHVEPGRFYGHPASLVWEEELDIRQDPYTLPTQWLQERRTRAAVLLPHGSMASSPSQPVFDTTGGRFGPFTGQMFLGEMNQPRIIRVMVERVDGAYQGACVPFFDGAGLNMGNNRLAFGPDGALWVGQTERSGKWVGGLGIQRIAWTGRTPMEVLRMSLTQRGFELTFTRPLDRATAADPAAYRFHRYRYAYHAEYGSDQLDRAAAAVTGVSISGDRRTVSLTLAELKPGYVYELKLRGIRAADGGAVVNTFICYTLNRLRR